MEGSYNTVVMVVPDGSRTTTFPDDDDDNDDSVFEPSAWPSDYTHDSYSPGRASA